LTDRTDRPTDKGTRGQGRRCLQLLEVQYPVDCVLLVLHISEGDEDERRPKRWQCRDLWLGRRQQECGHRYPTVLLLLQEEITTGSQLTCASSLPIENFRWARSRCHTTAWQKTSSDHPAKRQADPETSFLAGFGVLRGWIMIYPLSAACLGDCVTRWFRINHNQQMKIFLDAAQLKQHVVNVSEYSSWNLLAKRTVRSWSTYL
jgi:hypothetical protein